MVWDRPNKRSYATIGEKNRFAKKTPNTIPKKYFLLKTIKWLNNSEIRN